MIGSCRLNNKSMRGVRRTEAYQAIAIDFAMLGVISKEECEMLIGGGIPDGIFLPNGDQGKIISEQALPETVTMSDADAGADADADADAGADADAEGSDD